MKEVRPRRLYALSSEDEATWAKVKEDEVVAQHEHLPPWFKTHALLSHDSASLLTFLDVEHGILLLFNPCDNGATRFVQFPASKHEVVGLEELDEEEVEVVAATVVCGFQTGKGMHVEGLS